jgi:hypothetical protein
VTGWRVNALPNDVYPTLIRDPHAQATGHLLTDLTTDERVTLDAFEHPTYQLTRLATTTGQTAWAYTAPDTHQADPTPWDLDTFATTHLPDYLTRCTTWRNHHERSRALPN